MSWQTARLLRFEANLDAVTDNAQGIDPDRRGGGLGYYAAVSNIESGTVQRANKTISPQATTFQLGHRVRTFILDSKKFILGVTNQNVMAGHLEGLAAAIRNLCNIGQILKTAVIQTDSSRR